MPTLLTPRDLPIIVAAATPFLAVIGVVISLYHPRAALATCCSVLLLAGTKFRARDAQALLEGNIDGQVIFELVLFAIVAAITARNALRYRASFFRPGGIELLLGGYVGLTLVSVLWATNLEITAVRSAQLTILLLFALLAVRVFGPHEFLRITMISVSAYVLVLAALVLEFPGFVGGRHWFVAPRRFSWFGVHPLMVAMYAGSALILLLAFTLFARRARARPFWRIVLDWLAILALAVVVVLTRSRAALLAISAGVLVLLVRRFVLGPGAIRSRLSMMLVLLWTGVVAGLLFQQLARGDPMSSRLGTFFMRGQSIEALRGLNGRDLIWAEVVALFAQQPIVGYGYLASRVLLLDKIPWAGDGHFALAESLMNVGGLGTALVFIPLGHLLVSGFYYLFRSGDEWLECRAAVAGGTVFILLNSMSTPGFAGPPSYEVLLFFVFVLTNVHMNAARMHRRAVKQSAGRWSAPSWTPAPLQPVVER